jgi:hypothetical protein
MGDEIMELNPVQDVSLGLDGRGLRDEMQLAQDSLRVLADETVGRATVATNDFAGAFDKLVEDNSAYYVLGFRPANERADGRLRKLQVKVKRPGLTVRSRNGFVLVRQPRQRPDPPTFVGSRAPGPLRDLLQRPIQQSGLPMSVSAAVFKGKTPGKANVLVTAHFGSQAFRYTEQDGKFHEVLEVSLVAFDRQAKSQGNDSQLKLDLKPQTRQVVDALGFRYLGQIELAPGLYQLRVVARAVNGTSSGSVYYDVEVPDYSKGSLVMSGLLVSSAGSARIPTAGSFEAFKEVLPAPPTTIRDFVPADTLAVVAEIYDNEKTAHTLDVTTSVLEVNGTVRFHNDQQRSTDELASVGGGAFIHKALVPLKDIAPGEYTLRVEARSRMGKKPRVYRDLVIRVQPAPPPRS